MAWYTGISWWIFCRAEVAPATCLVLTLTGVSLLPLQYFNLTASRIAQSSKRDNTAMKTTCCRYIGVSSNHLHNGNPPIPFLNWSMSADREHPPFETFLSMSFFDYGEPQITVSPSIWIYFAVAIPVSTLILGGMSYWLCWLGV